MLLCGMLRSHTVKIMPIVDCPECFKTPCECGYEYRDWSEDRVRTFVDTLLNILEQKEGLDKGTYRRPRKEDRGDKHRFGRS